MNNKPEINLKQIPQEGYNLKCPCCDKPVLIIHSSKTEVPGGGCWINDGDTINGLYQLLTESQKTPDAFFDELEVGKCRHCKEDYYVISVKFINSPEDKILEAFLTGNCDTGPEQNFLCYSDIPIGNLQIKSWLVSENNTPGGPMHSHTFGPFSLADTSGVIGIAGVQSCGRSENAAEPWKNGINLLLEIWDELRKINQKNIISI